MARRREFDEAEVVERAMQAFWAHGYRATTPQLLVDATGLSKSSLYATFDSKQGLFLAALDRYIASQIAFMGALLSRGTLREGLERMYATMIAVMTAPDDARYCLVCTSSLELPGDDRESMARVARGHQALTDLFVRRFERAVADGELPSDADPVARARFVVNSNMGLQVTARANPDQAVLRDIAAQVLATVC